MFETIHSMFVHRGLQVILHIKERDRNCAPSSMSFTCHSPPKRDKSEEQDDDPQPPLMKGESKRPTHPPIPNATATPPFVKSRPWWCGWRCIQESFARSETAGNTAPDLRLHLEDLHLLGRADCAQGVEEPLDGVVQGRHGQPRQGPLAAVQGRLVPADHPHRHAPRQVQVLLAGTHRPVCVRGAHKPYWPSQRKAFQHAVLARVFLPQCTNYRTEIYATPVAWPVTWWTQW